MGEFLSKHIYKLLIISLVFNFIAVIFVARKIYYNRLYAADKLISDQNAAILNYDSIPPETGIDKTILLNTLVEKFNYISYLEIGQGKAENNFYNINCKIKIGVDPDPVCKAAYCLTSDEFFKLNRSTFDLIFIDGLHHNEQVYRDIINSLNCLNINGTIVVHDCNPRNEAMQIVPQKQGFWTGDVWRAWVKLRSERTDIEMFVVNTSNCGVIRVGEQVPITIPDSLTYKYFSGNREYLLNTKSINDFIGYLKRLDPAN